METGGEDGAAQRLRAGGRGALDVLRSGTCGIRKWCVCVSTPTGLLSATDPDDCLALTTAIRDRPRMSVSPSLVLYAPAHQAEISLDVSVWVSQPYTPGDLGMFCLDLLLL